MPFPAAYDTVVKEQTERELTRNGVRYSMPDQVARFANAKATGNAAALQECRRGRRERGCRRKRSSRRERTRRCAGRRTNHSRVERLSCLLLLHVCIMVYMLGLS